MISGGTSLKRSQWIGIKNTTVFILNIFLLFEPAPLFDTLWHPFFKLIPLYEAALNCVNKMEKTFALKSGFIV